MEYPDNCRRYVMKRQATYFRKQVVRPDIAGPLSEMADQGKAESTVVTRSDLNSDGAPTLNVMQKKRRPNIGRRAFVALRFTSSALSRDTHWREEASASSATWVYLTAATFVEPVGQHHLWTGARDVPARP